MAQDGKRVRYAVVGLGNIAQVAVLPAFEHAKENCELVALVSGDAEKREKLGKRYSVGEVGSYEELEGVLERSRADVAYIATPNTLHRPLTERAARAGVHVLCEKPMATSVADCEAMIRAAEENGVKLMIAYRLHFEEANLKAIEAIESGKIGNVRAFTSEFSQQVRQGDIRTKKELGGGALYDVGIYCLNAARYILKSEPIEVFAYETSGDERFEGVDETTMAVLRFADDRFAQFVCSQGLADVSNYRVLGSKGDLRLDPAYGYAGELKCHLTIEGETEVVSYPKRDQFAPELVYFANCILDDREPEPSGEEGLADVRVLEAIKTSARSGQPVLLQSFERSRRPDLSLEMRKPPVEKPETVNAPSPSM